MTDDVFDKRPNRNKKRELELLTIRNIMSTENGRDFLYGQLYEAGVFISSFNADPILHAFIAGKRENGLRLEAELKEAAPKDYIRMLQEKIDE